MSEKDHFATQLYTFMDDLGTPLNEVSAFDDIDVDLYKLFKVFD